MTPEDIERITKLAVLAQTAAAQVLALIQNHQEQNGKTSEEILNHAAKANSEARTMIDSLH